LAEL
ncbi:hypothetical protein D039_1233B, partial [Vibrio parahaemolyticus EKP-028]|jgi:hypothetical protein